MKSDRILYLTEDRSEVVEQGDPRAITLFALIGTEVSDADAARYGLTFKDEDRPKAQAEKPADDAPATVKPARQDVPFQAPPKGEDDKPKHAHKGK